MSKRNKGEKNARATKKTALTKEASPSAAKRSRPSLAAHAEALYAVLMFASLWIFCSWVYGSVFHLSQQTSYFAWSETLMRFLLQQPFGWLYAAGRLLLTTFHYPALGGLVLALLLSACSWLVQRIFRLSGWWRVIPALLPFAFLAYFVSLDYSINYHRETSALMAFPFAALVVLSIVYGIEKLGARHRTEKGKEPKKGALAGSMAVVVAFAALTAFSLVWRDGLRRTCTMMRQLEQSDYEGMIDAALASKHPSRSVAAYHAVALAQTGQLETRVFEIPYKYPRMQVREMDGQYSDGVPVYSLDADFYAGFPNEAYSSCMENMVKIGPQIFLLKRLARAAMVNGERRLCWKYLQIIDRNPFEHEFVRKHKEYINNMQAVRNNPEYKHIYDKMPVHDQFAQIYRKPLFLGYNVRLMEGRSIEALHASLVALLYTKDLDGFLMRASLIGNTTMPEYYQQAVVLKSLSDGSVMSSFPAIDRTRQMAVLRSFVGMAKPYLKSNQEEGRKLLKDGWTDYYPYYMYFENLTPEHADQAENKEKGGVN